MDMVNIFPELFKLYNKWNIRGFVILSLCLQIILLLFTPFRKRSRNPIIIAPIWLAYVLADWAASFAIGLISNHQGCSSTPDNDRADILAFWATFLLLHLGGPDNASAFALEDNTFWQRQLIGLIGQVLSTIIVFFQPLPRKKLWISTIFIFVAGTIKYGERTYALYSANLSKYQKSLIKCEPEPDHAKILERSMKKGSQSSKKSHASSQSTPDLLDATKSYNVEVVKCAHDFLGIFKGLVADVSLRHIEREKIRKTFLTIKPEDALRVLEVELNLVYEVFYTKVIVVYTKLGCVFRFLSWWAAVTALLIFFSIDKRDFLNIDVKITYALLFGAIGLDTIALFMLAISDWTVVYIQNFLEDDSWRGSLSKCFHAFLKLFLALKRIKRVDEVPKFLYFDWIRRFLFGFFFRLRGILFWRWSGSLYTCNLIDCCLKERPIKSPTLVYRLTRLISVIDYSDGLKHVSKEPVGVHLWAFIFEQLKKKAKSPQDCNLHTARMKSSAASVDSNWHNPLMKSYAVGSDYCKSLLIWHIATDLCYEKDDGDMESAHHKMSKILSDYMLYLLVMQPTLMSFSGTVKIRLRDTYRAAEAFVIKKVPEVKSRKKERAKFYKECLEIDAPKGRAESKQEKSKSLFFHAFCLLRELEKLNRHRRWKLISEVWVELLSYAANHCNADMHVAQLSKGGELITFVWLLMAHFSLRDDFTSYEGIANIVSEHM